MVVNRLFRDVFERYQLLKGIALAQHGNVLEISFKYFPNFACGIAVPNKLKFGFYDGGDEDAHCTPVRFFKSGECFGAVVLIGWIDLAGNQSIQVPTEFDFGFETPLFVCRSRQGIDR